MIGKKVLSVILFPFKFVINGSIKIVNKITHPASGSVYRILLNYLSFIVACWVVLVAFITAQTYLQLVGAVLLFPLIVYFIFKIFPRKSRSYKKNFVSVRQQEMPAEKTLPTSRQVETAEIENVGISDIDKRVFLKLIGGAGISLFLFSIFNKRVDGLFFKNSSSSVATSGTVTLADVAGNKIDPVHSQPTDGYRISEVDDDVISFHGFTNKDGAWFVMRGDLDTGSFRYSRGDSNFPSNWTNRKNLKYDYFNNVFTS